MQIISKLEKQTKIQSPVLTIGNFDGVHLGHQKIFKQVLKKSDLIGGSPVAMTFDPHPIKVLCPDKDLKLICPVREKYRLMFDCGIKHIIVVPFDKAFACTEPEDFVKSLLVKTIGVKWIVVGDNYNFGKAKRGNTKMLRAMSKQLGFGLTVVRSASVSFHPISSSAIRSLITKGKVYEASLMLGRFYYIEGKVVKGTGRGSKILQIPTANIDTDYEVLPKEGVYVAKAKLADKTFDAVINIGTNPTFGSNHLTCEVHILNFDANIVNQAIKVTFIQRLRDEKRFENPTELKAQILKDIAKAKEILALKNAP